METRDGSERSVMTMTLYFDRRRKSDREKDLTITSSNKIFWY